LKIQLFSRISVFHLEFKSCQNGDLSAHGMLADKHRQSENNASLSRSSRMCGILPEIFYSNAAFFLKFACGQHRGSAALLHRLAHGYACPLDGDHQATGLGWEVIRERSGRRLKEFDQSIT
jgi:hypothetical protein